MLIIKSTDISVEFEDNTKKVYPKNYVRFQIVGKKIYFIINDLRSKAYDIDQIKVDDVQATVSNIEDLLSSAVFRNASGDGSGVGGNGKFKGYFSTQELLTTAFPSPNPGDYAYAGNPYPGIVYECQTANVWNNTGNSVPVAEGEEWSQDLW